MPAVPMISAAVAIGLPEAIENSGTNPDEIFRELHVDRAALCRSDGFIPCSSFARILDAAAHRSGDAAFGLHFGAGSNPKNVGSLAYAVMNSPTIEAAFETAARYIHLHNEAAQLAFSGGMDLMYWGYTLKNLPLQQSRQFVDYGMAAALNVLRMMVGSHWSPREVHFQHEEPQTMAAYREVFRSPVVFASSTNGYVLDTEFCKQPVPAADPNLFRILTNYLDVVLSRMRRKDEVLAPICATIVQLMKDGGLSISRAAKGVGLSARSLQRQLKQRGLTFAELVDDARRELAVEYLKDRDNTLTEIAFLLGYSEVSAFNRAFKRWTGKTPSVYRRQPDR